LLYDSLKIIHIISATCVLTSIVYSYHIWRSIQPSTLSTVFERIQTQTLFVIIPFAIFQLATGFTMISLKHYPVSEFWISGSIASFIVVIVSWLGFMYFLLLSQQATISVQTPARFKIYRRIQTFFLLICALGLLSMVFFMANKTA